MATFTLSLKQLAILLGFNPSTDTHYSEKTIEILEAYPDLHFIKKRKTDPNYRTLIFSDVEKIKSLLPEAKRKELAL